MSNYGIFLNPIFDGLDENDIVEEFANKLDFDCDYWGYEPETDADFELLEESPEDCLLAWHPKAPEGFTLAGKFLNDWGYPSAFFLKPRTPFAAALLEFSNEYMERHAGIDRRLLSDLATAFDADKGTEND